MRVVVTTVLLVAAAAGVAQAQSVQVTPFVGYRFGGGLFETVAGTPLDLDGAPAIGALLDVPVGGDQSVTFLYSHQHARVDVPTSNGVVRANLLVEHWHVGGAQETAHGAVRPLVAAGLGLTRFGRSDNSEVRFSFGGGGGVKLMPSRHVGVRLDGRVYGVVVNGDVLVVCVSGLCSSRINAYVTWQIEFTAGAVIAF